MSILTCAWKECERTDIFTRGLCKRCHMRARRAGIIDQFEAPARTCRHCGGEFRTGKNGKHSYCSLTCAAEYAAAKRIARRVETMTRPCSECGETIDHTRRSDATFCSTECQQAVWYRENDVMLKARAAAWKIENRDMAKDSDHRRRAAMRGSATGPIDYVKVWDRDGGFCWICRKPVDQTLTYPDPMYRSWDHVIPVIKGGSHTMDNVALSHLVCNTSKKSKILDRLPAWAS